MNAALLALFANHGKAAHPARAHVPHWLIHLGIPGLFLISFLDGSPIPLPIPGSADLLLILLCAQRHSHPAWLAVGTVISSVAGGYLTWRAGKSGGEAMLHHFAPKRMVEPATRWMKSHGGLTIAVSAVLPPPIPLLPLLLAAGAFGSSRRQFFIAFGLARGARYGLEALIGVTYGRHVLHLWEQYLARWTTTILVSFFSLLVAGMLFGVWQYRKQRRSFSQEHAA